MGTPTQRLRVMLAVLLAALAGAGAAGATDVPLPPPDGPDFASMVLSATDYTAGGAARGGLWHAVGPLPAYFAENRPGRFASIRLQTSFTVLILQTDEAVADSDFTSMRLVFGNPGRRAAYVKVIAAAAGRATSGKVKLAVGAPRELHVTEDAIALPITYTLGRIHTRAFLDFVRIDRVEAVTLVMGASGAKLPVSVAAAVASAVVAHLTAGLAVTATAPPLVTGMAQQGQLLTADHGHWAARRSSPTSGAAATRRAPPARRSRARRSRRTPRSPRTRAARSRSPWSAPTG